jgi:hypothetical protein
MAKAKNLTLATVKKVSKKLDETLVHIIEEGEYTGEQITFQPIFDDVKIEEISTELAQLMNEADEEEVVLSQDMQIYLIYMLTIKHFTHFKKDLPFTLLSEGKNAGLLEILDHFRKTGLFTECLTNMFSSSEISKVLDKMTDFAAMGLLSIDLDKQMTEKFESLKLKNRDVFEQLGKINTEAKVVQ